MLDTEVLSVESIVACIVAEMGRRGLLRFPPREGEEGGGEKLPQPPSQEERDLLAWLERGVAEKAPPALPQPLLPAPASPLPAAAAQLQTWMALPRPASPLSAVFRALPPRNPDPAARLCTPAWDAMTSSSGLQVTGGLPMRGSPTALHIVRALAQAGGLSTAAQPARVHLELAFSLPAARALQAARSGAELLQPVFGSERIAVAEAAGREEGEPVLRAAEPPAAAQGWNHSSSAAWTLLQGTPFAPLPPPALLYAAYDLWTAARWAPHYLHSSGSGDGSGAAAAVVLTHPRLLYYLPTFLRLDPCATAVIAIPQGTEGVEGSVQALSASVLADAAAAGAAAALIAETQQDAQSFAQAYLSLATEAAASFPTRVSLQRV